MKKPLNKAKLLDLLDDFGLPYEDSSDLDKKRKSQVSINLDQVAGYFPFASDNFDTFMNFEFDEDGTFSGISIG